MPRPHHEAGSVLIEALVAVLLIAAMTGLWFDSVAQTAHRLTAIDDRRRAMLVAQSQLAAAGVVEALAPGLSAGRDADLNWQRAVEPVAGNPRLATVSITVRDARGVALARLQSLKFAS